MSIIEANITIDVEKDVNIEAVISQINDVLRSINGKPTQINMLDMDNPIHNNPLNYRPGV